MSRQFRSDDTQKWRHGFGNGSAGNLTISSNTTEVPIDSACTGAIGTKALTATNASFSAGQLVLIIQSMHSSLERKTISSMTRSGSTVTVTTSAAHGYETNLGVTISGATQTEYNGHHNITVTNTTTFTFEINTTPATPATGSPVVDRDNWELNKIASYTAGTITLADNMAMTYASGSQVRVLEQYDDVTINSSITYTTKAYNYSTGGLIAILSRGTVLVQGTISASGANGGNPSGGGGSVTVGGGFQGGYGFQRTSGPAGAFSGAGVGAQATFTGGNRTGRTGGGSGYAGNNSNTSHGGGGANAGNGGNGSNVDGYQVEGGLINGAAQLTQLSMGGGGAGGRSGNSTNGSGGSGGGIILIIAPTITISGSLISKGGNPGTNGGNGGGGAGGAILLKGIDVTLGTTLVTALAGSGGSGGAGSVGYIHVDYSGSITGTTNPTLSSRLDETIKFPTTGGMILAF